MPVNFQCPGAGVAEDDVNALWNSVRRMLNIEDDTVNVRCVSEDEIAGLNKQYRGKDKPTNVLTFSYGEGEHDVAISRDVVRRESVDAVIDEKDYLVWVLVHAFLHTAGLDHEKSAEEAERTALLEEKILLENGYNYWRAKDV